MKVRSSAKPPQDQVVTESQMAVLANQRNLFHPESSAAAVHNSVMM